MRKDIIEASQLPESEKVYLKKDFIGYRVVEPFLNENNEPMFFTELKGKHLNKRNLMVLAFGGKRGLYFLIIVLFLTGLLYLGITELIENYKKVAESPCEYCPLLYNKAMININSPIINASNFMGSEPIG